MNEKIDESKANLIKIEQLLDIQANPIVSSFFQGIPVIGNLIDSTMESVFQTFQKKKMQELTDTILSDDHEITSDMVNDIEFIMNFAKTTDAVLRLTTNDKVKYFGNLIRNGYLSGNHIENDLFEEYLEILNTMTYREIQYLTDYKLYCCTKRQESKEIFYPDNLFKEFSSEYSKKIGISENELYSVFTRLKRTGFVSEEYETAEGNISEHYGDEYGNDIESLEVEPKGFYINEDFNIFYDMVLEGKK